jgi:hypothetical protein
MIRGRYFLEEPSASLKTRVCCEMFESSILFSLSQHGYDRENGSNSCQFSNLPGRGSSRLYYCVAGMRSRVSGGFSKSRILPGQQTDAHCMYQERTRARAIEMRVGGLELTKRLHMPCPENLLRLELLDEFANRR